jgi:hypothetical integral membrane protein (TIGR02206 family)
VDGSDAPREDERTRLSGVGVMGGELLEYPMSGWMSEFRVGTASHALALAWTLLPAIVACVLGRAWRRGGTARGRRNELALRLGWAGLMFSVSVWSLGYWLSPGRLDLRIALPLHVSDWAVLITPLALAVPPTWRWSGLLRALLYFWGLGLCVLALALPPLALDAGPATQRYWLYWVVHAGVVGCASYEVFARGYRPRFGDLATALGATLLLAGSASLANMWVPGANYVLLGRESEGAARMISSIGPWPARAYLLVGLVMVWFALLYAAWPALRWARRLTIGRGTGVARRGDALDRPHDGGVAPAERA